MPRIRDFRGVSPNSFDGRGNYTLGLREQLMFPEIDYDKIDKTRGLEISFVTTAKTDEEGRRLLQLLGMPFAEERRSSERINGKEIMDRESEPPGEVSAPGTTAAARSADAAGHICANLARAEFVSAKWHRRDGSLA